MRRKSSGNITIAEVARHAGVSTATAGRVLGQYGYASEDIRRKVAHSAEALGYRPNGLAKSLITGKTYTIGVVAGDIQSPFYSSILRGISDVLRSHQYGVLLTNSDEVLSKEVEAVRLLLEKQVDGLIIAPCDNSAESHLFKIVEDGCPVVQIDRIVPNLGADSVTIDNLLAARESTKTLLQAGHRRIGLIAELEHSTSTDLPSIVEQVVSNEVDPAGFFPSWHRLFGFVEAHLELGLSVDYSLIGRVGAYSKELAREQTTALLSREDRPTALFTTDGLLSAVAMDTITQLNMSIPEDLSLICFDDLDWMSFIKPGISAVEQPLYEMGQESAKLMMQRIEGRIDDCRHCRLNAKLLHRGSVAKPCELKSAEFN